MRDERERVIESVKEVIEIGKKSGANVHISHRVPKVGGWGKGEEMSRLLDEAKESGLDISSDEFGYLAGMTGLVGALPHWVQDKGVDKMVERLKDRGTREKLKQQMLEGTSGPGTAAMVKHQLWNRMVMGYAESNKELVGKTLEEIAKIQKKDPFDIVFDLLIDNRGAVMVTSYSRKLEDVKTALQHHLNIIASDGMVLVNECQLAKIKDVRSYGMYPRLFGKWIRKDKLMTLEQGVRISTSYPAQRMGIKNRGSLREGMCADIVVFDNNRIKENATYENLHQYPEGIIYVLVNGQLVVEKGKHKGTLAGKILRKTLQ
jgi:N-acyl-D-amino-acid deacylase